MLALYFNFVEVGEGLCVSILVDYLGVDWSLGNPGAALTLCVVDIARPVHLSSVAAVRLSFFFF